jgi:hypothetical protein
MKRLQEHLLLQLQIVMSGLAPGHPRRSIDAISASLKKWRRVEGREKPGHDERRLLS